MQNLLQASLAQWKSRLRGKLDQENMASLAKRCSVSKKIFKDLRALMRLILNNRFLKHEVKDHRRLYKGVRTILLELGLPSRFLDPLAVLLRPKQCSAEVREAYRAALLAFERVNGESVAAFFSVECYRMLYGRIFLGY